MDLSRNLLKAFSDLSKPTPEKKETYLYATAKVDSSGNKSVRIDGSTVDTPVESTAEIKNGERVLVTIDNNKAILVGNMSSPAARVGTVEEVKETSEESKRLATEAQNAANSAQVNADEAKQQAAAAQQAANNATNNANDAKNKADQVVQDLADVREEVDSVVEDAAKMRDDLEGEIETVKTNAEAKYATKTEMSTTETTLRKEISDSVAEVQTTMEQDYAKKTVVDGAIVEAKAELQTQITQNADTISSTAKSVEEIQVDITEQNGKIADAASKANAAQQAANTAQQAANDANAAAVNAQKEADEAKADLVTAQQKLAEVESSANANTEDIAAAQQAVQKAQNAADTAQNAADQAKTNAANAATAASNAQKAADDAQDEVDILKGRVTTAETNISQNSKEIALRAKKDEMEAAIRLAAEGLSAEIKDAEKKATDFLSFDNNGLQIGDKQSGEWVGFRSQLTGSAFNILDSDGDLLSSYGAKDIYLGVSGVDSEGNITSNMKLSSTNNTSTIELCYGLASMKSVENEYGYGTTFDFELTSIDRMKIESTNWLNLMTGSESALNVYHSAQLLMNADGTETSHIAMFASDTMSDGPDSSQLLLTSFGLDVSASMEIRIKSQGFMYLESNNFNIKTDNTMTFESHGNININTTGNGVVKLNGDRIMKATLPDGGYWGMVAPSGSDNVWLRTTSAGILPYAIDNTSKIGSASWKFSEGHFASIFATSIYTGSKKSASDGVTGVFLSKNGRIALQNTTGNPYISFYGPDATESEDCYISYNIANDYLQFGGATQYNFGNTIYSAGAVRAAGAVYAGYGTSYSVARGYYFPYKDGEDHSCVYRAEDGLTTYYGWAGSSSYATVGVLRGRTVKYANSSGTTTLSDERLKKDFESLDRWDTFFDTIEPCAFKMKHGNSGRFHIGFKAQQIEEALIQNGLSTQDFAGFIRMPYTVDPEDPETTAAYEEAGIKPGDDELGLLYSEFTALNTYEIQKLKKRIDELEALIKEKNNERETN